MKTTLTILLLCAASFSSFAQTDIKDLSVMYGKKWRIVGYGLAGQRLEANDIAKEDLTVFNADGTYLAVDKGKEFKGKWSYDPATTILTIKKEGQDEITELLVVSAGETETILASVPETSAAQAPEKMTIYLVSEK